MKTYDKNSNQSYEIDTNNYAIVDKRTGSIVVDSPDLAGMLKTAYGQKAFWKVYMADYIQLILGAMDYKQLDVLMYISMNTQPSTNIFIGTYKTVMQDCKCSRDTVYRIFKRLQELDYMKRKQNGVYMINPNLVMKGNNNKRSLLIQYYNTEQVNTPLPRKKNKSLTKKEDVFE
jgi:hypothetical protein